ncbi:hypothetical protein HDU67_008042 [Dinochytrium kinnereticum]|nr:hypothetical protein HDU67_008042 [Dinochytrium kinnereticum]
MDGPDIVTHAVELMELICRVVEYHVTNGTPHIASSQMGVLPGGEGVGGEGPPPTSDPGVKEKEEEEGVTIDEVSLTTALSKPFLHDWTYAHAGAIAPSTPLSPPPSHPTDDKDLFDPDFVLLDTALQTWRANLPPWMQRTETYTKFTIGPNFSQTPTPSHMLIKVVLYSHACTLTLHRPRTLKAVASITSGRDLHPAYMTSFHQSTRASREIISVLTRLVEIVGPSPAMAAGPNFAAAFFDIGEARAILEAGCMHVFKRYHKSRASSPPPVVPSAVKRLNNRVKSRSPRSQSPLSLFPNQSKRTILKKTRGEMRPNLTTLTLTLRIPLRIPHRAMSMSRAAIRDANDKVSMTGKKVVVVGGTQGIGAATALRFASLGASVLIVGRNPTLGTTMIQSLRQTKSNGDRLLRGGRHRHPEIRDDEVMGKGTSVGEGDQEFRFVRGDLGSVEGCLGVVGEVGEWVGDGGVAAVVMTAGSLNFGGRRVNKEGIETTFALNYLSKFIILQSLLPYLQSSPLSRAVTVLHGGVGVPVDVQDLQVTKNFSFIKAANNSAALLDIMTDVSKTNVKKRDDEKKRVS